MNFPGQEPYFIFQVHWRKRGPFAAGMYSLSWRNLVQFVFLAVLGPLSRPNLSTAGRWSDDWMLKHVLTSQARSDLKERKLSRILSASGYCLWNRDLLPHDLLLAFQSPPMMVCGCTISFLTSSSCRTFFGGRYAEMKRRIDPESSTSTATASSSP